MFYFSKVKIFVCSFKSYNVYSDKVYKVRCIKLCPASLPLAGFFKPPSKSLPPIAFNNELTPDYENCKENLLAHIIFIPSLRAFQPSINTKPETTGDFTRPVLYELRRF